jgi:hypothetical protein
MPLIPFLIFFGFVLAMMILWALVYIIGLLIQLINKK